MAEFRKMVITNKGQELIAKIIAEQNKIEFTKIAFSDSEYSDSQIASLTALDGVKQTAEVARITKISDTAVQVESVISNENLKKGYYIKTIALYAKDPDEGEVIYAACGANSPDWMPEFNKASTSGIALKLIIAVQNAENAVITVNPAAVATINDISSLHVQIEKIENKHANDIENLQFRIDDVQGFVGYTDTDIYGVETDMENSRFTRLSAAKTLTPGSDFDGVKAFGGRKRCILADDGAVLAYYGEENYTESGKLTKQIVKNEKTYPIGTAVQVMVEQPKFYYKVVPIKLERIQDGIGFHLRKARYYISDYPKPGFKPHPAFIQDDVEKDCIYLSAYEGCLYDASAGNYILNDEQVYSEGDKLSSIAGAKPASGRAQNLYRETFRNSAAKRGVGWKQQTIHSISVTQILFLIEYATFNAQSAIGTGVTNKSYNLPVNENNGEKTGATAVLGNNSGSVINDNGFNVVSYRGEENFFGNSWKWADGINIYKSNNNLTAYIAKDNYNDNTIEGYESVEFSLPTKYGYISCFGYDKNFDWIFIPSKVLGNSEAPVGDYVQVPMQLPYNLTAVSFGGDQSSKTFAGAFYYHFICNPTSWDNKNGRLIYIP